MFIELLNAFTTGNLDESSASNSEWYLKCVFLNNQPCQFIPTLDTWHLFSFLINMMEVLMLLVIHMLNYVFQIKLKI